MGVARSNLEVLEVGRVDEITLEICINKFEMEQ